MDERSGRSRPASGRPTNASSFLRLVHSRGGPEQWTVPPTLDRLADATSPAARKGRSGRRPHALLILDSLPRSGHDPDDAIALACALRRQSHEVTIAPVDGDLDGSCEQPPGQSLSENGIACLGRPRHRSIEELLAEHAGSFDLVCLLGAALSRAYEPIIRLHDPSTRIISCLPGLRHPGLMHQAGQDARLRNTARIVQRQEILAAYVADAAIVTTQADAALLEAALPSLPIHRVPWTTQAQPALDESLHRALGTPPRNRRTSP